MSVTSKDLINHMGLSHDLSTDMLPSPAVDAISARANTEPVLSDDIWNKIALDFPELSGVEDIFNEIDFPELSGVEKMFDEIDFPELSGIEYILDAIDSNDDCMWAGHCPSKKHPTDDPRIYSAINNSTPGSSRAPSPVIKPNIQSCHFAVESDHTYHKNKNGSMHMPNLGIDASSDSEEEIDVVSVTRKKGTINNRICSLSTNPSVRDREQIHTRTATAVSKNRMNGIKTILPIRKTRTKNVQLKRKLPESRVVKRTRQYRTSNNLPNERHSALDNSKDSEAEPLDKRSLQIKMERQRRIDLRKAFEDLRLLIPELSKKEKASKITILREASKYCYEIRNIATDSSNQLNELRRENEQLRSRISQPKKSLDK